MHHDHRPDPEPLRGDRNPARVIARRKGDDAALALLGRELQKPVGCTPQLECAAGLKTLALQPDWLPPDIALDQWSPLHESLDSRRRFDDVAQRQFRAFW